jgi:hypothetical protein
LRKLLLIEQIVEHDHHQGDDQPQGQVFVKWVQKRFPPGIVSRTGSGSLIMF